MGFLVGCDLSTFLFNELNSISQVHSISKEYSGRCAAPTHHQGHGCYKIAHNREEQTTREICSRRITRTVLGPDPFQNAF